MAAIYYAIDTKPRFLYLVAKSIESVRRFDSEIPIYLHVFGGDTDAGAQLGSGCTIIRHPAQMEDIPTFLKWLPLAHSVHDTHDRLLFLDADTIAFAPVRELLDRLTGHDFYAREENRTDPDKDWSDVTPFWRELQRQQGSRVIPIFNTGVMVFNHGLHRKVGAALGQISELKKQFIEGRIPYPCSNWHIMEELAASLVLGRLSDTSFGLIASADSPWYEELRQHAVQGPGVVMHVWNNLYADFLEDFEGKPAREAFVKAYA